jgi:hypothetical protein
VREGERQGTRLIKRARRTGALPLTVLGLCTTLPAGAADPVAEPAAVEAVTWDATRRAVRRGTEWLVQGVDGWFGDKPFAEGGEVTDGRLDVSLMLRQNQNPDFSLRLNANLKMPNADRFATVFLGRDDPRDIVSDKPEDLKRRQLPPQAPAAEREFFAGVGLKFADHFDVRLGLRGGLKPYAQLRYRQAWQWGSADRVDFRQTLFWSVDDHVGSTTAMAYEHVFSPTLAARWLGAATITQRASKFDWSNSLGLYRSLGAQRLVTLEVLASGLEDSGVGVLDYGLQLKWEQPVHEDWLVGEVTVGHFWPRPDALADRGREWALGGRVIMKF